MSRFSFYEDVGAQKLAIFAHESVAVELEKFHRERRYGRLVLRVEIKKGLPSEVVVTPEVRLCASNLASDATED